MFLSDLDARGLNQLEFAIVQKNAAWAQGPAKPQRRAPS
jgi:hypothetical protein